MTLEDSPSLVGQTLLDGKLDVERKLGEGGMGVVYRVRHRMTKHARALKVLHAPLASHAGVVKRFMREATVAGQLDCPRVVETYDAGVLESGAPYVLMELLEGESLADRLEAEVQLAPERAVQIALEALEGLVATHAAGIVHRDLKPENLFLVRDRDGGEHVKLLDFGISKFHLDDESITATGNLLGTPMYMSPEQTEGAERADARSDLYAMGVILYEALSGATPFEASSLPKLLMEVHLGERRPLREAAPEVAPALVDVVERAMARAPEDRYPSASAFIRALEPFAVASPPATASRADARTLASERPAPAAAAPRRAAWIAGAVALSLAAGATAWSLGGGDDDPPEPTAREPLPVTPASEPPIEPVTPVEVTAPVDRSADAEAAGVASPSIETEERRAHETATPGTAAHGTATHGTATQATAAHESPLTETAPSEASAESVRRGHRLAPDPEPPTNDGSRAARDGLDTESPY